MISIESAPIVPPDVAAPPATARRTVTGLAYAVIEAGTGARHPRATSTVRVHYSGWTTDGELFDSSVSYYDSEHATNVGDIISPQFPTSQGVTPRRTLFTRTVAPSGFEETFSEAVSDSNSTWTFWGTRS